MTVDHLPCHRHDRTDVSLFSFLHSTVREIDGDSSARGNTSLESAVSLTKSLRWEIQSLGQKLAAAANADELVQRGSSRAQDRAVHAMELKKIIAIIRKLLNKIEDAVPLINLAITASGASLSSTLPSTVSPSRLLQASTFLTAGDTQYSMSPSRCIQIGPSFTLSLYMLFAGHLRPESEEDVRQTTWKEVMHKAEVNLLRVPLDALYDPPGGRIKAITTASDVEQALQGNESVATAEVENESSTAVMEGEGRADEFAYQLVIVENLDDDRVHTFEEDEIQPGPCEGVEMAGIRESIPIHEISKIFYADTGKILNIGSDGETNNPILLLKRDVNAVPPRTVMERYDEGQSFLGDNVDAHDHPNDLQAHPNSSNAPEALATEVDNSTSEKCSRWRLPAGLDPEWMAFEVYVEPEDSDSESEAGTGAIGPPNPSRTQSLDQTLTSPLSRLNISPATTPRSEQQYLQLSTPPIRTSLSLLETLLRLLSLQQFQQAPHLSIPDELLTFFLSESASTGSDGEDRKRLRNEARRRVGFDPYDESPIKRHGEEYQYQNDQIENDNDDSYWTGYNESPSRSVRRGTPLRYGPGNEIPSSSPRRVSSAKSSPAPDKPQNTSTYVEEGRSNIYK